MLSTPEARSVRWCGRRAQSVGKTSDARRRHWAARARGSHRVIHTLLTLKSARALHSGGTIGPMRVRRVLGRVAAIVLSDCMVPAPHLHVPTLAHRSQTTLVRTVASGVRRPRRRERRMRAGRASERERCRKLAAFCPFCAFSVFCTFPVSAPFCVFSVFGRFHALWTQFRVKRGKFGTRKRRIV